MRAHSMLLSAFALSLPVIACQPAVEEIATTEADVEAVNRVEQVDLSGQDVGNLLGIAARKFSFALSKSSAITCWVDSYDRGVMKPQEVIKVDVSSASKKGDVIISLGRLGDSSEETIQVYLSVVTYGIGSSGSTTNRATVENFFQGMNHGSAREEVSVEYGKDIVLWKLAGSREGGFSISSRNTLEELVNKSDKTLVLKIRFSEK